MDFAVAVRSVAVRVGVPPRECRACRQPTPPTLATPSRELIFFWPATTTSTMMPAAHLSSIVYQHFTLCPSSSQRIISNRHFPRPTSLFVQGTPCLHSYLPFSSRLIFPYWLVTFDHVHAACTHLNLVYLYQPIVIGEAFRLFVILLLLALPCLNSLTRCVITCPIWLNNPRQRGLEVLMNLSQPRFSPQAAAILTCSGFFLPHRFHKW